MTDATTGTETPAPPKPGYKTTEFYMKLAAILLTAFYASGVIPIDGTWMKVAAIAATMLGALGYTVSRTMIKAAGAVLLVMLLSHGSLGCAWVKGEAATVGHALVDCTKPAAVDAFHQFGSFVDNALVASATPDGKVTADTMKSIGKSFTSEIGQCVFVQVVAHALAPKPADPNAPKSEQLVLDAASLRAGFEAVRGEQLGGATYKTDTGVL